MKDCFIATVVFAAGILVGLAFRPSSVRAQATALGNVYVEELSSRDKSGTAVRGSQIVGFSCAEDGSGAVHCYAASVNR